MSINNQTYREQKKEFTVFSRQMNNKNKNFYLIDKEEVDLDKYLNKLEAFRLSPLQIMKQDSIIFFHYYISLNQTRKNIILNLILIISKPFLR